MLNVASAQQLLDAVYPFAMTVNAITVKLGAVSDAETLLVLRSLVQLGRAEEVRGRVPLASASGVTLAGVTVIEIPAEILLGSHLLHYTVDPPSLAWDAGPATTLISDGNYRIYDSAVGASVVVSVSTALLPAAAMAQQVGVAQDAESRYRSTQIVRAPSRSTNASIDP